MIKVVVKYVKTKIYKQDAFIYTDFLIEGHANDGSMNSIKCCAGISAICVGVRRIVCGYNDSLKIDKGFFHYSLNEKPDTMKRLKEIVDWETQYGLNLVLCQLYDVYLCYKHLFTSFEMVEEPLR